MDDTPHTVRTDDNSHSGDDVHYQMAVSGDPEATLMERCLGPEHGETPETELRPLADQDHMTSTQAKANCSETKVTTDSSSGNTSGKYDKHNDASDDSRLLQDHGWAWLVCFGCFFSHVVTGGFERSDGVMFLEFTDRFNQRAQLTAWPASICSALRLVMGPAATAMCNRFSARASVMTGALFAFAGLIISGFAPNVTFLIFSYGIVQGIGRGLVYAPGLICTGLYFKRRRGLAVGLSTAGVGFGTFVLPPVAEWMFQHYGFQGTFLILGAVILNVCIAAALYRPFFIHRNIVLRDRKVNKDEEEPLFSTTHEDTAEVQTGKDSESDVVLSVIPANKKDHVVGTDLTRNPTSHQYASNREETLNHDEIRKQMSTNPKKPKLVRYLQSVFETCFPTEKEKQNAPKRKLIEWSLLKIPSFFFYCLSICLFNIAFKSAFTFLPALAKSRGISPSDAALLLSVSGILDTTGRIMSGLVLDFECIRSFRPIIYNAVPFLITGLSFMSPFMKNFAEFAVLFGLYGMLTGTYVSQKSVILVDILGEEKLSSSFGLMIFFQGMGTLVGPPLSGLLKDVFGRFTEAFFLGGAAMALAGALMIMSNIYRVLRNRRVRRETADTSDEH